MNNTELATKYLPVLDEVYKAECKTAIFEGDETTVQKGQNGELKIAKIDMDALGDFSRNSGYTEGNTSLTWETIKYDKERSQKLKIDRLDNEESLGILFSKLASTFLRTKVIPETDAARVAKICGTSGITVENETLSSAADVIAALRTATNKMDEDEVPAESRVLLIVPTLINGVEDLDTTKSREVLNSFSQIIKIPQTRMYSAVELNDGTSAYGYKKAEAKYKKTEDTVLVNSKTYYTKSGDTYTAVAEPAVANIGSYYELTSAAGRNVNFLVVEKSAFVCAMDQYVKYFSPDQDQDGDSHVFPYRNNNLYGHCYENKLAGIYASIKNS